MINVWHCIAYGYTPMRPRSWQNITFCSSTVIMPSPPPPPLRFGIFNTLLVAPAVRYASTRVLLHGSVT